MDPAALIARLSALSGPDDDLNGEIAVAAGVATEVNSRNGRFARYLDENGKPDEIFSRCPHYTGHGIDAAMGLIPDGFSAEFAISVAPTNSPELRFTRCRLWDWRRGPLAIDPANEWKSEGNRLLAINICIAAIKARNAILRAKETERKDA